MTEKTQENIQKDYWFLRDNGAHALTAIFMVGLAYKEESILIALPRRGEIKAEK